MTRSIGARRSLTLSAALATLLVPLFAAAEGEGEDWVEVTGEAAIVGDNEVHAREMARDQALRQAVEMVAGTIVTGISETQQFISVRDDITSQGAGFVRRYEVKDETCGDGTCRVTVRALVAKGKLSERLSDLGLLLQRRGFPRVVMLIAEQNVGEERPGAWWSDTQVRSQVTENTLVEYLNKTLDADAEFRNSSGRQLSCGEHFAADDACWTPLEPGMRFRFMDYRSVSATPMVTQAVAGTDLTDTQAAELAKLTDAEVALVGTARATDVGDPRPGAAQGTVAGNSVHAIRVTASVRAVEVQSGNNLGAATVTASFRYVDAHRGGEIMLRRAARELAPQIQKIIADAWGQEEAGGRMVRLQVDGIGSFNDLIEFQNHLRSGVTGVRSVQQRKMEGSSAELEVRATITAEQLATELATRPVGRFSVRVTRVDSSSVGIHLGN